METKTWEKMLLNPAQRKALGASDPGLFARIYLRHYLKHITPAFHKEIYEILANDLLLFILLFAFRGSAKSTIVALIYSLYCAVTGKRKFIIPLSDSFPQAKLHITNIIAELENNKLLQQDFGPFQSNRQKDEWTATNIVLDNGTRILSRSRGQKIRGVRHLENRPDLIIGDDLENNEVVRTKEQRDKTFEWWSSEVVPALDTERGKLVLIGNLLHNDSLMARQKKLVEEKGIGIVRTYPLVVDGECLWPERFDDKAIERLKAQVGSRFFQREYLLKLIPDEGQIIKSVQRYSQLPKIEAIGIGVDLAISQKQTADYTSANVIGRGKDKNYYNIENIAGRWSFNDTLEKVNQLYERMNTVYKVPIYLGIEDVAYQRSAIEEYARRYSIKPQSIKRSTDKRSRLESIQPYFESGQILFRENDDEDLINEILNFGIEQHDDRMDAFEISLNLLLEQTAPDIFVL